MHTVDRLDAAVSAARALGYQVRMEWLGGSGGGGCEIHGRKWLFIDLAIPPEEQLQQVQELLSREAAHRDATVTGSAARESATRGVTSAQNAVRRAA
jgi:hypothetical protein